MLVEDIKVQIKIEEQKTKQYEFECNVNRIKKEPNRILLVKSVELRVGKIKETEIKEYNASPKLAFESRFEYVRNRKSKEREKICTKVEACRSEGK
jgi:hypothetical protein